MENLFKDAYFGKSFMMIGDSLPYCLGCSYCRANDGDEKHYGLIPTELNPKFKNIPVAVNLFYGDPMIQIDNTLSYLDRLEKAGHTGPVIIITKGNLRKFPRDRKYNLDLHFGLSTFGVDTTPRYDGGSMGCFRDNLEYARELGYKYSVEFRPIINHINDDWETIEDVFKLASEHNTGIGYCGLQVSPILKKLIEIEKLPFIPYEGCGFGMKKYLPPRITSIFDILNQKYIDSAHAFRKTSCLIAWKHGLDRDPNAHYYRPNEVGCKTCPMYEKCMAYKNSLSKDNDIDIPFDYEIVEKDKHVCGLFKLGVCKFPSSDCMNINGKLIKINEKITTTDVRLIKWLTGYTVDAEFVESPFMSKKWIV